MADTFLDPGGQAVAVENLKVPQARELAAVLRSGVLSFVKLVECRHNLGTAKGDEAVVFDVDVERPQLVAHAIRREERIAAVFSPEPDVPEVFALRADFPQVPHINLRADEFPRSLCLDARPWVDVSRRWTAAWFVERIRWWLAQTAKGTLHRDDQPLEPLIFGTAIPLILPPDLFTKPFQTQEYLEVASIPGRSGDYAFRAERVGQESDNKVGAAYVAIALRCSPQQHGVIRHAPKNLDDLHALTAVAGLDLKREIRDRLQRWRYQSRSRSSRLIIVLSLPKQRISGGPIEEVDVFAVACPDSIMDIGLKLGEWRLELKKKNRSGKHDKHVPKPPKAGDPVDVVLLRPVFGLTSAIAAQLSGREPSAPSGRVAVGAGALGSQVLLNLARAGYTDWTVIDDDRLLPHNLQRHALTGFSVGYPKAESSALYMNSLFPPVATTVGIPANLLDPGHDAARVSAALAAARYIIDMSASVATARHLAWLPGVPARRTSLFLNPSGTDLILLAEDAARTTTLDSLEMQYYRMVLQEPRLANHMCPREGGVRYSASCRDVSARMPTHLVAVHAGVGAGAIGRVLDNPEAAIMVWQADRETLAVEHLTCKPNMTRRCSLGEWTLILDDGVLDRISRLRRPRLPNETGGILLGAYDMRRRAIYVVDTIPSPLDSKERRTSYIRGCEGLSAQVMAAQSRTGYQLEYVGEWHSHPEGSDTQPSGLDRQVFAWIADHLAVEGLPGLMAIVGGDGLSRWFVGELRHETQWRSAGTN